MIHDKGWLDQMLLYIFLEEEVENVTFFMTILIFNMMLICQFLSSGCICNFVEVNICVLLNRVYHCDTLKRFGQIHCMLAVSKHLRTGYFLCNVTIQVLCQVHHAVIVCICLI